MVPTHLGGKEKDVQETIVKTNDAECIHNDETPDPDVRVNGFCNAGVRLLKVYQFFPKKDQNQTTF